MNVFDLFAKITLDTGEYEEGLNEAGGKTESFADKLKGGLATAAKVGAAAIAAVSTAATAMSGTVIQGVSQTAEYGDSIDKMSQKMGMTAEAYQEWDAVMQHCGTSIESMQASMKTLASAAETGNDAFEKLGISQESISSMSQEELFGATIEALQNVESETERTYLAGKLLGRGATELGALLNTSAADTQAMKDRVHELGGVMSDEAVKAAAAFQDNLQDMKTAISGIKRAITADFMPGMNNLMEGFTKLIAGEEGAEDAISKGIDNIAESFSNTASKIYTIGETIIPAIVHAVEKFLPVIIDIGADLIMQLVSGIVSALPGLASGAVMIISKIASSISENLPELIPSIIDVVIQIVETLIDNVDMLVDASIQIIIALSEGIIDSLPKLIEKVPEIIAKLIEAFANNAPKLIEAAIKIMVTLASGIISNIPKVISAIPQIITSIINGFDRYMGRIKDIGKNIVTGVWEGIKSMASWIADKVSGFFGDIVDGAKDFLGIHSPSTVFAGIGKYMAEGLGEGWEERFASIKDAMQGSLEFSVTSNEAAKTGAGIGGVVINVTVNGNADAKTGTDIGRAIANEMRYRGVLAYA